MKGIAIFSGNSNIALSEKICAKLEIPLGHAKLKTFSDGEIQIEVDDNVRMRDVFLIQSTCAPVNDNLMELLLMIDAVKRSSAMRITAVIPYYGYARQDKKVAPRVPISAKLVADMLTTAGANRVITMDLHAKQIQGFFNIPVDNLFASSVLLEHIRCTFEDQDIVVVSPDAGGVERARAMAKRLSADLAIVDKRRNAPNEARAMAVIGDVTGKVVVLVDDMVDTAGTLTEAAGALIKAGAKEVHACCSHPVLSGPAIERIEDSALKTLITTDSIPLGKKALCTKIEVLTIADLVAEAIIRSHNGESITSLFI